MKLFLILAVVTLAFTKTVVYEAQRAHGRGRAYLSHSKVMLEEWNHKMYSGLRRHDLSTYKQVPLETTHFGFTLAIKVEGLDYKMSMDTGSADVFIKGEKSPGVPNKKYRSRSNYKKKPKIAIGYLDGSMDTYEAVLDVEFAQQKFKVPLLVAYTAPKQFEDVQGLIGLSYPEIARHKPTFIQTLIKNKIISNYSYGMNLNLIQDNRSFITFGQADDSLFEGQMIEYPIGKTKEIKIDFNWIKIGDNQPLKAEKALLDTGNTCISIAHQYQAQILNAFRTQNNRCGFYVQQNVPMFSLLICRVTNFDELPVLTLNIGGNDHEIQKQFYLQDCQVNPQQPEGVYYCESYIQSTKYNSNEMIFLGDAFFNRFYTFFDLENQKVGIAKNRENITIADIIDQGKSITFNSTDWEVVDQQPAPEQQTQ